MQHYKIKRLYLLKLKKESSKKYESKDIARWFTYEFGKSNHALKPNESRPVLQDEHEEHCRVIFHDNGLHIPEGGD